MRKYYFLFLLLLGFTGVQSQDFTVDQDSIYMVGEASDFEMNAKIYITAGSTDLKKLRWVKLESDQPSSWLSLGICDNNNCYTDVDSETFDTIPAGTTDNIKAVFYPQNTEGMGIVKVFLYSVDGKRSDGKTLTFVGVTSNYSSISNDPENKIKIFPNPVNGLLNIDLSESSQKLTSIEILSISGQTLFRKENPVGRIIKIQTGGFPQGVYFVKQYFDNKISYSRIVVR